MAGVDFAKRNHIMRLMFVIAALALLTAAPARSADSEFTSSFKAPGVKIASITIAISDKVRDEKLRWGPRDIKLLKQDLRRRVTRRLQHNGLMDEHGARLELTLDEIIPSRPTAYELARREGLSLSSPGFGGAAIKAHLLAANGADLGVMRFRFREGQAYGGGIFGAGTGPTPWYDARQAFEMFSRRLVKTLQNQPSS